MNVNSTDKSERYALVRGLGLWSATAIVIGETIGTGIFLVASHMARAVGSAPLFLFAWYGYLGSLVREIFGILVLDVGHASVHKSPWALRVHLHHGPTAGSVGPTGCDGPQLQCADEWCDPGSADFPEGGDDLAYRCGGECYSENQTEAKGWRSSRLVFEQSALC